MPASKIRPVPDGYHSVIPYMTIDGAERAIAFYKTAFGAKEIMRIAHPDGKIGHAELSIGDSKIMLSDEFPEMGAHGPRMSGGSGVAIHLYVEDVDETAKRATAAGAKTLRPVEDKFYGDRMGSFEDPFGHVWHVATHKEDVPSQELRKRAQAAIAEHMRQHAKA